MLGGAIDPRSVEALAAEIGAVGNQIEAARLSALRKMRKRIITKVKRSLAERLQISQKAVADRFFSRYVAPGADELEVWIGTWALSPFSLGLPQRYGVPGKTGGVKVSRRTYRGAFMAKVFSSPREKVWVRLHSAHYRAELYPGKYYNPGIRSQHATTGRFPLVKATIPVNDDVIRTLDQLGDEIAADFEVLLRQELNYQVNVKGAV
jgi:hypothetical protein